MNVTEFLGRQNRGILVALGTLLLAGVAVGDFSAGPRFESSIFYLIPLSFFSWFLGRRVGLLVAFASAALTFRGHSPFSYYRGSSIIFWSVLGWLGVYIFFVLIIAEIRVLYERERRLSRTDTLTRISNRRDFLVALDIEKSRALRYGLSLTLAYVDLDHFKLVNDRFGHSTGDDLLAFVASMMKHNVRESDIVARIGGDEFAVLLPETDAHAAAAVLHKLRNMLNVAMQRRKWPVTFSMGAVTFHPPPESTEEIIDVADQTMYSAKMSGRDRVIVRDWAA